MIVVLGRGAGSGAVLRPQTLIMGADSSRSRGATILGRVDIRERCPAADRTKFYEHCGLTPTAAGLVRLDTPGRQVTARGRPAPHPV